MYISHIPQMYKIMDIWTMDKWTNDKWTNRQC